MLTSPITGEISWPSILEYSHLYIRRCKNLKYHHITSYCYFLFVSPHLQQDLACGWPYFPNPDNDDITGHSLITEVLSSVERPVLRPTDASVWPGASKCWGIPKCPLRWVNSERSYKFPAVELYWYRARPSNTTAVSHCTAIWTFLGLYHKENVTLLNRTVPSSAGQCTALIRRVAKGVQNVGWKAWRDYSEDLDACGRIILKWILGKQVWRMLPELMRLRIQTSGGLWIR
jgi:hypothetical protein